MADSQEQQVTALDVSSQGQTPAVYMLNPEDLSQIEKQILTDKLGWNGKDPVPSDLAKRLAAKNINTLSDITRESFMSSPPLETASEDIRKQAESLRDSLPEGFKLPEKDLDISQLDSTEMVSDEEVAKYLDSIGFKPGESKPQPQSQSQDQRSQQVFNDILKQASEENKNDTAGLHPSVAAAAKQLDSGQYDEDPLQEKKKQDETPEVKKIKTELERAEAIRKEVDENTSTEDKEAYRDSILSFDFFEKEYVVAGGVKLIFRDMSYSVEQMLLMQATLDQMTERVRSTDYRMIDSLAHHYRLVSSLAGIIMPNGNVLFRCPKGTDITEFWGSLIGEDFQHQDVIKNDTNLRKWSVVCFSKYLRGALRQVAIQAFREFTVLNTNLQLLASRPDFLTDQTS